LAIEKQLGFISRCVNVNRRDLSDTIRPIPMGENMRHRQLGPPVGLIDVVAILRKAGEVDNTKVGATRGIERRRFAEVIPPGPDELAGDVWEMILYGKLRVGRCRPARVVAVVRTHLVINDVLSWRAAGRGGRAAPTTTATCNSTGECGNGERVNPARADRRCSLATVDELLGLRLVGGLVIAQRPLGRRTRALIIQA